MTAVEALRRGVLKLLPERAAWSETGRTLFVADLHLGKASAFRALGAPAPTGASEETLRRLGRLADGVAAERLVILGDFVHARGSLTGGLADSLRRWRGARMSLDCVIVLGNHDRGSAHLYGGCGFASLDAPVVLSGAECRHQPLDANEMLDEGPLTLAGHLHPVARLTGPGRDSLRLPCFVLEGRQIVLPAFGEFTGGSLARPGQGVRIIAAAEGRLIELFPRADVG
jgi:uncharacterized protein